MMDPSKDFFEVLLEAVVKKAYTLDNIIDIAYESGVEHGEALKRKKQGVNNDGKRQINAYANSINSSTLSKSSGTPSRSSKSGAVIDYSSSYSKRFKMENISNQPMASSQSILQVQPVVAIAGAKDYVGVVPVYLPSDPRLNRSQLFTQSLRRFTASITLYGRTIQIGTFIDSEMASIAHDRALIRALGPKQCQTTDLNYPLTYYSKDPLDSFAQYDSLIKAALFGTSWSGPKDCDFSFLVLQAAIRR
jgi:hypothetical protein